MGGTLIDRFGARRVVLPALAFEATAMAGGSTLWAGQNTILTSLTTEPERQKVFGLQFALLNLGIGIGVGAAVSGMTPELREKVAA